MNKLIINLGKDQTRSVEHTGVVCPNCEDIIFSCAHHDFHPCSCRETFIDGGFDYIRVLYNKESPERVTLLLVGVNKHDLYKDWNENSAGRRFGKLTKEQVKLLTENKEIPKLEQLNMVNQRRNPQENAATCCSGTNAGACEQNNSRPTLNDSVVIERAQNYIARGASAPTLKQIQSALKGVSVTCEQLSVKLKELGYSVGSIGPVSKRTVSVR